MPEVVADRSSLLRSKRHDIALVSSSRKRKLRELYAVYNNYSAEHPIPAAAFETLDNYPPTPTENQFLIAHALSQNFKALEDAIPATRRRLRSDSTKASSSGSIPSDRRPVDIPHSAAKGNQDDASRRTRGNTPVKDGITRTSKGQANVFDASISSRSGSRLEAPPRTSRRSSPRASSRGSQTDLPAGAEEIIDTVVDESIEEASRDLIPPHDEPISASVLEEQRIANEVESRPGSPGIDPRKAIPPAAEDIANLLEPIVVGSHDEHHKAFVAHLPPKEDLEKLRRGPNQKRSIAGSDQQAEDGRKLFIQSQPPQSSRNLPEALSSPGSTLDALSATTPVPHEVSTDTSPDNEGNRYDIERTDEKDEMPDTPAPGDLSGGDEGLKSPSRSHAGVGQNPRYIEKRGSSPAAVDAQLRLEEEQAAIMAKKADDTNKTLRPGGAHLSSKAASISAPDARIFTKGTAEFVENIIKDNDQASEGVAANGDIADTNATNELDKKTQSGSQGQGDAMDIDQSISPEISGQRDLLGVASQASKDAGDETRLLDGQVANTGSDASLLKASQVVQASSSIQERMSNKVDADFHPNKPNSEMAFEFHQPITAAALLSKGLKDPLSHQQSTSHSRSITPQSPGGRLKVITDRAKEKERSKLSTVMFAKQPSTPKKSLIMRAQNSSSVDQFADYALPLITAQASVNSRQNQLRLEPLIAQARKTLTTANLYMPIYEQQSIRVLRRILDLQGKDRWSLRQPKRCPEPNRPTSHWDELLKEAKWMRTDFREERKWKIAVARNLAYECAAWVASAPIDRKTLQVNSVSPPDWRVELDAEMEDVVSISVQEVGRSTPDLIPSGENESLNDDFEDDEISNEIMHAPLPASLFSLNDDEVIFGLRRSPATDQLLDQIPLYAGLTKVNRTGLSDSDIDPDASWRQPALPLSKFIQGKIVLDDKGPPKKKSRYDFGLEEEEEEDTVVYGSSSAESFPLPPVLTEVALFNPENKHIRDRIHAGHQFRPPTEFTMPTQSFFECRNSSQWTVQEDDELKMNVRKFSYNWSLISSLLTSPSMYSSSAERRTPWECFERWIHLEGLPADMGRTTYFRIYNSRLEAAQRNLLALAQQPPQPNAAGILVANRKRSTTSVRVDRRRSQKHLTLVDAMRKLAKKRETNAAKSVAAAQQAENRRKPDTAQPAQQQPKRTPQQFSEWRIDRERELQERIRQQEAARRAALQVQAQAQAQARALPANGQHFAGANGNLQQPRNPQVPNMVQTSNVPLNGNRQGQLTVPGQNLPRPQMQIGIQSGLIPMANTGNVPQLPMNGIPQGQLNGMPGMPNMQGMPRIPGVAVPNPQLVMQARQISEQQRQAIQQQQNQVHTGQGLQPHNSSPNMRSNMNGNMNGMNLHAYMPNNGMMANAFNAANMNGVSTPPAAGFNMPNQQRSSSSPRMGHPSQLMNFSGNPLAAKIEHQFRTQYPQAAPEQVNKYVRDAIASQLASQQAHVRNTAAMQAAAGNGPGLSSMSSMPNSTNPQQYAQMLRAQQEKQQQNQQQQQQAQQNQNRTSSAGSSSGNNNGAPK